MEVAKMKQDDRHHAEDLAEQKREFNIKNENDKKKLEIDKKKASKPASSSSK